MFCNVNLSMLEIGARVDCKVNYSFNFCPN